MVELPPIPASIAKLPRDERGYPVPWFVAWVDGKPEFRVADGRKWADAVQNHLCWVCGEKLSPSNHVFVIGPMCAVNKTTSEPPCHKDCAHFSVKACPFLSLPKAKRREGNMPDGACDPAGHMIDRNPGVSCLWRCRGFELFDDGRGGTLIHLPNPSQVEWWTLGRKASRSEVMQSISSGLPLLEQMAAEQGPPAIEQLREAVAWSMRFLPKV